MSTAATIVVAAVFVAGAHRAALGRVDGFALMLLGLVLLIGLVCWFPAHPGVPA